MYTSCRGATIVMTQCTIVLQKNVALHATMTQTDLTIAAP